MKIFGDIYSNFPIYGKEPGFFFDGNDVLKGQEQTFQKFTFSFFENSQKLITVEPKLYLHIPKNLSSFLTGILREYLLPWRWKAVYLDKEDGSPLLRILVCTSVHEGELSERLNRLLGRSLLVTNLINKNCYDEIFGKEFIIDEKQRIATKKIIHPLGELVGKQWSYNAGKHCHIYRQRSILSTLIYIFLKCFSNSWKEITIQVAGLSEKILIQKTDEETISGLGLILRKSPNI